MIDFPHRLGLWTCIVSELELVERQAEGDKSERVVISGGGLEDMQRMHHRVMQRQAEQYVSYTLNSTIHGIEILCQTAPHHGEL